ncbi:Probable pectate lyase 5 [Striga hermonthica]|uniref:Pectate lyase n=1 Tax=Striga hermonthica TaxID=68872 RepID=A0A9N7MRX1_STRHE|nr:Probable pectate lyase 5 [Striga hermonthica]
MCDQMKDTYGYWDRMKLADCAMGFGKGTTGGKDGEIYLVTSSDDGDVVSPKPGTIRHAVIQEYPVWIIFSGDMVITLKEELIITSDTTIDGRGANVVFNGRSGLTIQFVENVIIHGVTIRDMSPGGNTMVRSSTSHYGYRMKSDGDGICIFGSKNVWIDHCNLQSCTDGLIDAVMGSTDITVSNNYFANHNEVMLFGHADSYTPDTNMRATIAYNYFAEGLTQRMPRCRHGHFHVVNNKYERWKMYAIGGSANPFILAEGNHFIAPDDPFAKEVTKHEVAPESEWQGWYWRSYGNTESNGAFFTESGADSDSIYQTVSSLSTQPPEFTESLIANVGPLNCNSGQNPRQIICY